MIRRITRVVCVGCMLVATAVACIVAAPGVTAARAATANGATGYQQTISGAVTELQAYWTDEYPQLYGNAYVPIPRKRIVAARPGVKIPACQGHRTAYADVRGNAFYCVKSNFVAYDDVHLMPSLAQTFGTFSLALVLAHEWGHAVQDRAGTAGFPGIYVELQADCFAGGFLRYVSDNRGPLTLAPGDLEASLGAMLQLRDRARPVTRRPLCARERVRPGERVPGRLRVRPRTVRDLLQLAAGARRVAVRERPGSRERR